VPATGTVPVARVRRAGPAAADWLRGEARRIRSALARTALLSTLGTLALLAQAWVLAGMLERAVLARAGLYRLWPQGLLLLLLALARFGLGIRARQSAFGAAQTLARELRARLLRAGERRGPLGLRAEASGDLITRLVDGIEALLNYFARYLPQLSAAALVPLLLTLSVFPVDWLSGLILLLTAPLIPLFMMLVGRAAARASEHRYAQLTRLGALFIEALGGLVTLRQLGAAERFAHLLERESEEYRRLTMQVLRIAFLSALVLEFFAMVSIAIVAVLIGFRLLWGELHLRAGLFVLLLAPELYAPLRALGALRHTRMDALAAAERLSALEDLPADAAAAGAGAGQGVVTPARSRGAPEIRIERIGYTPAGRKAALRELSLVLEAGRVTALVGATGAGKSTLLSLLLRFASPESGRILVDGSDLATLDPCAWRERVAWVPQQSYVFEGTVRENLLLAAPCADERALARAVRGSALEPVLERLPRGLDTALGERGLGLSGGELQRLALARALLRERADLWLLDEPTAHLDAGSARDVERIIREAATTRTVLVAAHRLSAARSADWVAVLRDGRVVEQGTSEALDRRGGEYSALLLAERS
jgi:ATP-binding cassette subfamily C protein CydD